MLKPLSSWARKIRTGTATSFIRKNYKVPAERKWVIFRIISAHYNASILEDFFFACSVICAYFKFYKCKKRRQWRLFFEGRKSKQQHLFSSGRKTSPAVPVVVIMVTIRALLPAFFAASANHSGTNTEGWAPGWFFPVGCCDLASSARFLSSEATQSRGTRWRRCKTSLTSERRVYR